MKILRISFVLVAVAMLNSCDTAKKIKESTDNLSAATKAAENLQEGMAAASKKLEERKAKGDTLAMNYKDLQAYLPAMSGYEKDGDPSGETMNSMGFSLSTCEQRYKKGDENITVKITDYNAGYSAFVGITAMIGAGFSSENDNEKTGTVNLGVDGVKAFETVRKKEKSGSLVLAIADRFFVEVKGDNLSDTEKLQAIAKNMDLGKLAEK